MSTLQNRRRPLWTAYEAAAASGGSLLCRGADRLEDGRVSADDWQVEGISFDTRSLQAGDLFVALHGARDGHDFIRDAAERGARAALVSRIPDETPASLPLLKVPDTVAGLSSLGAAARDRNFGQLIAVTGSVGKTTTKEMLRSALATAGTVHAAEKSFNNHLGVPTSLASLPDRSDYGVFEIGMNHSGEITPLTALVRPHVAIITTVAPAHLGNFASVDEIAAAKGEILSGVRPGGVAILNADNEYYDYLVSTARSFGIERVIPFGSDEKSDGGVRLISYVGTGRDCTATVSVEGEEISFRLASPGRHLAMNALAVLAAAKAVGAPLAQAISGLEQFRAGEGRGAQHQMPLENGSITILDEAYNANPASMAAAFAVLGSMTPEMGGRRIAVLGEMKELGDSSHALHASLGLPISEARIHKVWLAGMDMASLRDGLAVGKLGGWAETAMELEAGLVADLQPGDVVLFKGSNASGIGALLSSILAKQTRQE